MQDLNDLYYFARVVEHGEFAPAGRALGMPKSTLSRRIALLEERLGSRLLQRSTRHFGMTEVGEVYYRHCVAMIAEAEAAQEAIDNTSAEPRGTIRVTCPISLMFSSVAPIISRYLAAHPQVRVQLSATNRRVDVIEEGVDVALRVRFPPLECQSAFKLGSDATSMTVCVTSWRLAAGLAGGRSSPVHTSGVLPALTS